MNFESNQYSVSGSVNMDNIPCEDTNSFMNVDDIPPVDESIPMHIENEDFDEIIDPVTIDNSTDPSYDGTDSPISDFEEKYSLTKLKYPDSAVAALKAMVDLSRMVEIAGQKKIELQSHLTNEYIFGKIEKLDEKGIPRVHSEFQLMNILTEFICNPAQPPAIRNAIILSVFPSVNPRHEHLGNLVCFSIWLQHDETLNAVGTWMQQVGSTSECCQRLAMHVVHYFCHIVPNTKEDLIKIAKLAPYFTANLLTAVAEVFTTSDPPDQLLDLINTWLDNNPNILTASLSYNPVLPSGGIPMTPITPIAGLCRWCILFPAREDSFYYDQNNEELVKRCTFYNEIHQKIFKAIRTLIDSPSNKHAISTQHIEEIMQTLVESLQSTALKVSKASYDIAMGRLYEVLGAASEANCIYGNIQRLTQILKSLEEIHASYGHS